MNRGPIGGLSCLGTDSSSYDDVVVEFDHFEEVEIETFDFTHSH